MSGTCFTDLSAITLTGTAKAYAATKATDINGLLTLAKSHATELTTLLQAIVNVHPTTGGDAANLASLNAIIGELA